MIACLALALQNYAVPGSQRVPPARLMMNVPHSAAILVCVNAQQSVYMTPTHVHRTAHCPKPVLRFLLRLLTTAVKRRRLVKPVVTKLSVYLAIAMLTTAAKRWQLAEPAVAIMSVCLALVLQDYALPGRQRVPPASPGLNVPHTTAMLVCVHAHQIAYMIPPHV